MKINYFFIIALAASVNLQAWPPALQNCGNTCFLNSTIQVLYNTPPLTKHIIETHPTMQNHAVDLYINLITEFEKSKEESTPKQFDCKGPLDSLVKSIQAPPLKFNLCGGQEDAIEFMRAFLNQLNSAFPTIHQLYESNETSLVHCPKTQRENQIDSRKTDPIDIIELPIEIEKPIEENKIEYIPLESLGSCLSSYFHSQNLEEYSGRNDCIKTLWIENPKEILFISLRRFRFEIETLTRKKLSHTVSIPFELNINPYLKNPNQNNDYKLIGAIIQSGTLEAGHYWAYVQDLSGQWYNCNDAIISKVNFNDQSVQQEINGKPNGPTGYLFVYQKASSRKKSQDEYEQIKNEREQKDQEQKSLANLATDLNNLRQSLLTLQKSLGAK